MYKCGVCGWNGSEPRIVKTVVGWEYAICPDCMNDNLKMEKMSSMLDELDSMSNEKHMEICRKADELQKQNLGEAK